MKERLLIFLGLALLVLVLVGLNAASFVQKETLPDMEFNPNRSTYNVGATGTRAFYDLLAETGRKPSRWQKPPSALLNYGMDDPTTFVIIGRVRREFSESEYEALLKWVSGGGTLVVIDRDPPAELIMSADAWKTSTIAGDQPGLETDPSDQNQMTTEVPAAKPVQPTLFTQQVNAVQTSRFASSVNIVRDPDEILQRVEASEEDVGSYGEQVIEIPERRIEQENSNVTPPDESPVAVEQESESADFGIELAGPVVHLAGAEKNLLVEFPYGSGRIALLTDPYVVSNSGIGLVDNSRLATNLVAGYGGIIAFDEYHQGYGANNNPLINYFEGTPVFAFLMQFAALIGLVVFARGRRFARPLAPSEPNRLSKLEYVSAMAELQSRTKAFDLAIENVYKEFRLRAAKQVGADNLTVSRDHLAKLISARTGLDSGEIDKMMFKCEDIIHGEPTNRKEILDLICLLREIEQKLGLQRNKVRRK